MVTGTYISIIILNVNGLMLQPEDTDWLNGYKNKTRTYAVYRRPISRDTYRLKVRGWKKIFHANGNQKKAGVAILISDKIDFKDYYKKQRRTLYNDQGINPRRRFNNCRYLYTQHRSTSINKANANSHKREISSHIIIVGDFNTPLSPMDRSSKMKINKETQGLNYTLNKMDLIDIYRTFHPKTTEYTFFSGAHGHPPGQTISWVTNQALVNLRKLKSYQVSFLTTMLWK